MKTIGRQIPKGTRPAASHERIFHRLLTDEFEKGFLLEKTKSLKLTDELGKGIVSNAKDETWLLECTSHAMIKNRATILTQMFEQFYNWASMLGWNVEIAERYAYTIIPFLDVSERSCYTHYGHQYRTMQYAELILDERGTLGRRKAQIMLGALLHDIGKVGVPNDVLRYQGQSQEIFVFIQRHPGYGKELLSAIFEDLGGINEVERRRIISVAFSHQEQFCGRGYPKGAAGSGIPIGGRIVALADVFDAVTSKRRYQQKAPMTFVEAMDFLKKEMDRHFNANVVRNFCAAAEKTGIKERIYELIRNGGGNPA